jgi:xanthine dehydrogenase YagR molybdenum-binding subunit
MASYRKLKKGAKKAGKFEALAAALAAPAIGTAAPAATQTVSMPIGIPGVNLSTVQRTVPADEPPVLPINKDLKVLGKRTQRLDAHLKVTGQARYTYDVHLPGMLYGKMHRSPHPHARVKNVDTSAAERYPGVRGVYIIQTVIGSAVEVRDPQHANPKVGPEPTGSKFPVVRYVGQPIAAVAATSQQAAEEAARLVKVEYELLPFVVDLDRARQPDAPLVFGGRQVNQGGTGGGGGAAQALPQKGNVRGPNTGGSRGNADKGFREAEIVVEGEFKTQVQTHSPLETHGVVADWKPEGLTIYISTQHVSGARSEFAELFSLPASNVRVISEFMGGGFGAKYGAGNYGVAATHLSKQTGRPVRLVLDRREEHLAEGNRPNSVQTLRIGAKKDGTLTAIEQTSYGTAGVGLGAGVGRIAVQMYETCPNAKVAQYDVMTHAGPGAAFRAPGAPQGAFALEQLIDELAERIGLDRLALRDKIDKSEMRKAQRRLGAEKFGWSQLHQPPGSSPGVVKRGVGIAQSEWGRYVELGVGVEVRIHRDGSVALMSAVQDLGTGVRTILAQVAAEELGLQPTNIAVRIGDTVYPPGPASGGSKTTGSITPAARNAAYGAGQLLLAAVAPALGVAPAELAFQNDRIVVKSNPGKSLSFKEAAAKLPKEQISVTAERKADYGGMANPGMSFGRSGGVQFVEVAVDTETGYVKVERVVGVHDCGRPLNPLALESQINGGILQGISWALYENRHMDRNYGHMMNANLDQYKILGSREVPKIEVLLVEEYTATSSTDAMGVAESANVATAAAVANAVYNAIGVRIRELPITPQRILNALVEANKKIGKV